MMDTNPSLIQPGGDGAESSEATPLVLVHDGGGTTFSYWCLGELDRPVWGLHNPRFYSGEAWEGGIHEMARLYVDLVRRAVPPGNIILGGWSLGGILAVEMARLLAGPGGSDRDDRGDQGDRGDRPGHTVVGIVMVDSLFPKAAPELGAPIARWKPAFNQNTRPETRRAIEQSFREAHRTSRLWSPPTWERDEGAGAEAGGGADGRGRGQGALRPPPAVLLRAMEVVPDQELGVGHDEVHEREKLLGWDRYRDDFVTQVVDVEGHHFNIFSDHIDDVTEKLKASCEFLEGMA